MRSAILKYWRCDKTRFCVRALTWPLLALAVVLVWLSLVGLPEFAQRAIHRGLETAGIPLEFENATFDVVSGLTLKQVSLASARDSGIETSVSFSRVVVGISHRELMSGSFVPNALRLEDGVGRVASGEKEIQAPQLTGELRRHGAREWTLSTLVARIGAFELKVDGAARLSENFVALFGGDERARHLDPEVWSRILEWLELINSWESEELVKLAISFGVDERSERTGAIVATLRAPAIRGATWSVEDLRVSAAADVEDSVGLGPVTLQGKALGFRVGPVEVEDVSMSGGLSRFSPTTFAPSQAEWRLSGTRMTVGESVLRSFALEIMGNAIPPEPDWRSWFRGAVNGTVLAEVASIRSPYGNSERLSFRGGLPAHAEDTPLAKLEMSQVDLTPFRSSRIEIELDSSVGAEESVVTRPASVADFLRKEVTWSATAIAAAPRVLELPLRTLEMDLDWSLGSAFESRIWASVEESERVEVRAVLDREMDKLHVVGTSDLRLEDWRRAMPEDWMRGLRPFEFATGPSISFEVSALNLSELQRERAIDAWLRDRFTVEAQIQSDAGSYRDVSFDSAKGALNVVEGELRITDIQVQRPEGEVTLNYIQPLNDATYRIEVAGSAYPHGIKPLLGPETQQVFDHFEALKPVEVAGEILGPWNQGRGSVKLRLSGSDWALRGEPVAHLKTNFEYIDEDSAVIVSDLEMELDSGTVELRRGKVELANQLVQIDGWNSRVVPDTMGRAIDPEAFEFLNLFGWYEAPEIRVDGTLGIGALETRNLVVEIQGGRSMIGPFFTDRFQATFDWTGSLLSLSSFEGNGYGGAYSGKALFDLSDAEKTGLSFSIEGEGLDARRLLLDSLEDGSITGELSGSLHVDSIDLTDLYTWKGNGDVRLEGGALIDEPVFGIVSTLLNRLIPGLGNTRASRLEGRFEVANKEIVAKDLEISGSQFGIVYTGTVGFDGNVDATAEAFLFDEDVLLGKIGNLMLKPVARSLRFQINGPVDKPEVELIYLAPRLLSVPLRPIDTIEKALQFELPF